MLFDTHCHVHTVEYFADPDSVIAEAKAAGVTRFCLVGVHTEDAKIALTLAERHEGVYVIAGLHPNYCAAYDESWLGPLEEVLAHPKVVALGEIGLDFHWDSATREEQYRALQDQLDLAARLNMPVVFHCREANPELLTVLEGRPTRPYLVHCFSGDADDLRRTLALGCLIGVDGPVTYKKNSSFRERLAGVPLDRIVLETDSPFLSPEPLRSKPNSPANVPLIAKTCAEIFGLTVEEIARTTTVNANKFFRL